MTKLILSSGQPQKLRLDTNVKLMHSSLKNLGFEESGHTGFQPALSEEQLQNIALIKGKEDSINKVTSFDRANADNDINYPSVGAVVVAITEAQKEIDEQIQAYLSEKEDSGFKVQSIQDETINEENYPSTFAVAEAINVAKDDAVNSAVDTAYYSGVLERTENKVTEISELNTDEQYPSAKATYDEIQNKTLWELVDSAELTEDVQQFTTTENGNKYKELFLRIVIPTINADKTANFAKGRVQVSDQNGTILFQEPNVIYQDIGYNTYLTIHAKLFGNICITERTVASASSYVQYGSYVSGGTSDSPYGNVKTGGVKLNSNYLTSLNVLMYPLGERLFPTDTKYELWGVRA